MLVNSAGGTWREIARVTTTGTTTVNIPNTYSQLGFFVVGGGGSGHGDFNSAGHPGNGGNGGCVNHWEIPMSGNTVVVTVGAGGGKSASKGSSKNGSASFVVYNENTYTSDGGYGGTNDANHGMCINTVQTNSGVGGIYIYTSPSSNLAYLEWRATHTALETTVISGTTLNGGAVGQNGYPNPFDETDTNLYGAGGGGGFNAYSGPVWNAPISGGTTGGGTGGYGAYNTSTNKGLDATFYGGGGGGASFSSSHTYGQGGAGYQGIVIIYGK